MSLRVEPVTTIVVPSAVNASVRGALNIVAGANVTLDAVRAGRTTTLTISAEASGGSGLTQPQVLARLSMGV